MEYDGVTPITINGGAPLYVQNGRVTVLAYALGEMSFVDSHGTNVYEFDDTFYDLGQLFLDSNENGILDTNTSQPNLQEQTIGSAPGTQTCGTHIGGATLATAYPADYLAIAPWDNLTSVPSVQNSCSGSWGQGYVRRDDVIVLSGSSAQISQNTFTSAGTCVATYPFWLMDENYNPMPSGTTVSVNSATSVIFTYLTSTVPQTETTENASVTVAGSPVPDSIHAGGTLVTVMVNGGSDCSTAAAVDGNLIHAPYGTVYLDVTTPKGNLTPAIPINISQ